MADLGFHIEYRVGIAVLQYDKGGCHPASTAEVKLWEALKGEVPCTDETSRLLKERGELPL